VASATPRSSRIPGATPAARPRYLRPSPGAAETWVRFQHDDSGDTGRLFRAWTRLVEDIGAFQNVWTFNLTAGFSYGLTTRHDENNGSGTTLRRRASTRTAI
jgi:hypothetical protein